MPKSSQNIKFDECIDTEVELQPLKSAGQQLRDARLAAGRELSDIALQLRISERYLQYIEESNYQSLPEKVYTLGFVRTYAHTLGLDCDKIVVEFKKEITISNGPSELNFPSPVASKSVPKMSLILMTLAIAIIIYLAWYVLSMKSESSDQILEPPAIVMEPAPVEEEVDITPATEAPEPEEVAPQTQTTTVIPSQFQTQAGSDLTVFVQGQAWVEVRKSDGSLVFSRMMHEGDLETFQAQPGMTLSTKNAGGVFLRSAGKETAALGQPQQELEDYALPIQG